jgi:hypothetical protein
MPRRRGPKHAVAHLVFSNASKSNCSTVFGESFCQAKPCKSHPAYATRRAILHLPCLEKSNTRLELLVMAAAARCIHVDPAAQCHEAAALAWRHAEGRMTRALSMTRAAGHARVRMAASAAAERL